MWARRPAAVLHRAAARSPLPSLPSSAPTAPAPPPSSGCSGPPRSRCTKMSVPPGLSTRYTCFVGVNLGKGGRSKREEGGWRVDRRARLQLDERGCHGLPCSPPSLCRDPARQPARQAHACLRQQLLHVRPLVQLVEQHNRVCSAAGLRGQHLLRTKNKHNAGGQKRLRSGCSRTLGAQKFPYVAAWHRAARGSAALHRRIEPLPALPAFPPLACGSAFTACTGTLACMPACSHSPAGRQAGRKNVRGHLAASGRWRRQSRASAIGGPLLRCRGSEGQRHCPLGSCRDMHLPTHLGRPL